MPTLASPVSSSSPGNDSPAMKRLTVKPMPATAPSPTTIRQSVSCGSRPSPSRTAANDASRMPTGLPTTSPSTMPSATAEVQRVTERAAAERHPGVGEREDRQHDVRRQRVEPVWSRSTTGTDSSSRKRNRRELVGVEVPVRERLLGVAAGDVARGAARSPA